MPLVGRSETFRWGLITAVGVIAGYLAVLLANPRHYYTDDTEAQYAPMWVSLGQHLRHGHFPTLVPSEWMGGNYSMEEAGLYNPPQLLVDFLAPSVDNLALYVTVVKLIFSIIAALGVFRVCLVYGARAPWAALAAVAFPLSGWFLFFDESSWVTSLTGTAWLLHAWASAERYLRSRAPKDTAGQPDSTSKAGRAGPIPVFVFLYLAFSVQYVFPAAECAIMIAAVVVGTLIRTRTGRISSLVPDGATVWPVLKLVAVSGCAALAALPTYLPGILSSPITWRGNERVLSDDFLTVPWSESLNASLPSTVPAFTAWWGYVQPMPMVYIAWYLIPVLAFVNWSAVVRNARHYAAPGLFALAFLMWAAGPGTIGPLRWPGRVLPMLAVGLLVLVAILLSRHPAFGDWRRRGLAAGLLLAALFTRSVCAAPHLVIRHLVATVVVAALLAAMLWLVRTRGTAAAALLAMVAMLPIAYDQIRAQAPSPMSYHFPTHRSAMKAAFPHFEGVTLQLGDRGIVAPEQQSTAAAWGSLAFGNYAQDLDQKFVNSYTPIGHAAFSALLCMGWDGSTCPDAFRRAFDVEPTTGATFVDLLKVDRVVLQRAQYPDARSKPAPAGWAWVDYPGHDYSWVLERVGGPISGRNAAIAVTRDVTATPLDQDATDSHLRVTSHSGGRIVFARLAWPGYHATLHGHRLPIDTIAKTFVAVDIPPGTSNADLELAWRPPGWDISLAAVLAALVGLALLQADHRRRPRTPTDPPATPPTPVTDAKPEQLEPSLV